MTSPAVEEGPARGPMDEDRHGDGDRRDRDAGERRHNRSNSRERRERRRSASRDRREDSRERDRDRRNRRDRRSRSRERRYRRSSSRDRYRRRRSSSRDRDYRRDRDRRRRRSRDRSDSRSASKERERPRRRRERRSGFDADMSGNPIDGQDTQQVIMAAMMQQQSKQQQNPAFSYKARRVYVGNLPSGVGVTSEVLAEFFNAAMQETGKAIGPGACVQDTWMSSDCKYSFLEMRTPEEATNAMDLDGIALFNHPLKVARPHDYQPPGQPSAAPVMQPAGFTPQVGMQAGLSGIPGNSGAAAAAVLAASVASSLGQPPSMMALLQMTQASRRLLVTNLPDAVVKQPALLSEFFNASLDALSKKARDGAAVVACTIQGDTATVDFRTLNECDSALQFNGVPFLEMPLSMRRPPGFVPLSPVQTSSLQGSGLLGLVGESITVSGAPVEAGSPLLAAVNGDRPQGDGQQYGHAPTGASSSAAPSYEMDHSQATATLGLRNVVSEDDLKDSLECSYVAFETLEKCKSDFSGAEDAFTVLGCKDGVDDLAERAVAEEMTGMIMVMFSSPEAATTAAKALNGVNLGGRIVKVSYVADTSVQQLTRSGNLALPKEPTD